MAQANGLPNAYTLEFERNAQLIPTARIFAGALARQFGCDEDAVLDVKIAVSEACTDAVTVRGSATGPVRVVVHDLGSELVYDVDDATDGDVKLESVSPRQQSNGDQVMGVELIDALFPGAEISRGASGAHVRFRLLTSRT